MTDIKKLAEKLALATDLGPQNREINYKGRVREVFKTLSSSMSQLMLINIMTLLFCAPFVVAFIVLMPLDINGKIAAAMLNFSGGIGIGYGVVDQTNIGIEMIYNRRIFYFLCYFTPTMLIASIGFSGAYHCCRNLLWKTKTKVIKHFFRGISRHWWKFLMTFGFFGLVGTSLITGLFQLLKVTALQSVTTGALAGIWIWVIVSAIVALCGLVYCSLALPTYVQYNFSFKDSMKNTCLLLPQVIAPTLFMIIALGLPMFLLLSSFASILLYMFFVTIGLVLYILFDLAYGQYVNDNFVRAIYDIEEKQKTKNQDLKNKKVKKQAPKQVAKYRKKR